MSKSECNSVGVGQEEESTFVIACTFIHMRKHFSVTGKL